VEEQKYQGVRVIGTVVVTLSVWSLLVWQHLEGGVPSHNILARADLPAVSNWWGGLLLPALTWWLLGRTLGRISRGATSSFNAAFAFAGAGVFGVALAVSYVTDHSTVTTYIVRSLPLIALLLPLYRAEYVLGFVLAMTYTFGAILPTGFTAAVAAVAWGLYGYVRPTLLRIVHTRRGELAASSAEGGSVPIDREGELPRQR
jgi:hypothetical protein